MDRLIRRTRVKRSRYAVLGADLVPELVTGSEKGEEREEEEGGEGEGGERGAGAVNEEEDAEAFDDTDFYQLLLRDLIESSSSTQVNKAQSPNPESAIHPEPRA